MQRFNQACGERPIFRANMSGNGNVVMRTVCERHEGVSRVIAEVLDSAASLAGFQVTKNSTSGSSSFCDSGENAFGGTIS